MLRRSLRSVAGHVPWLERVISERDALREEVQRLQAASNAASTAPPADARQFVPPGHFYSAIPSLSDVRRRIATLYPSELPRQLPGIDLREAEQLSLLAQLQSFHDEQPFPERKTPPRRYWFENGAYSYSDALFLYAMIRHLRPRRIVEIGSGHSSCVTLDTDELFFDGAIACTFIEPYPELLHSLLRPGDEERITIVPRPLQAVEISRFEQLEANDILFVDSTHVSKIGSDVNHLFFEVLPRLAPGVHVHLHDIFYPFEYPLGWIEEGRAWSEAYLLRAFLTFNHAFEIVLFNTFLEHFHRDRFAREMPLCLRNPGGSIWLRRRA